jgi:hypothetical protein
MSVRYAQWALVVVVWLAGCGHGTLARVRLSMATVRLRLV